MRQSHTLLNSESGWLRLAFRLGSMISIGFCLSFLLISNTYAESLFRSGISYQTAEPYTPRSLFTMPRPKTVGDIVTITISESSQTITQNNATITRQHSIKENSSTVLSRIARRFVGDDNLVPSVDGLDNEDKIGLRVQNQKVSTYKDTIACVVTQVLPNGFLVVQGRKSVHQSKDSVDMVVSGIVNPFYLNTQNTITSNLVANLQVKVDGRGPTARQQGDGVIGKYFQFFN